MKPDKCAKGLNKTRWEDTVRALRNSFTMGTMVHFFLPLAASTVSDVGGPAHRLQDGEEDWNAARQRLGLSEGHWLHAKAGKRRSLTGDSESWSHVLPEKTLFSGKNTTKMFMVNGKAPSDWQDKPFKRGDWEVPLWQEPKTTLITVMTDAGESWCGARASPQMPPPPRERHRPILLRRSFANPVPPQKMVP